MPPRRPKLPEGTWFAVPIEDGTNYVLGVVGRGDFHRMLGWYFDHVYEGTPPTLADTEGLTVDDAKWIMETGWLGFTMDGWPVLGQLPGWTRDDWPVPVLRNKFGDRGVVHYRRVSFPDGPFKQPHGEEITREEWEQMPDCSGNAIWDRGTEGHVALQLVLGRRVRGIPDPPLKPGWP